MGDITESSAKRTSHQRLWEAKKKNYIVFVGFGVSAMVLKTF